MNADCKRCRQLGRWCWVCHERMDREAKKKQAEEKKPATWMERDAAHYAQQELDRIERRIRYNRGWQEHEKKRKGT